jgi:hypothetical protein
LKEIETSAREAKEQAIKAARAAAKALAKLEHATRAADALGAKPSESPS